jgi:integrase
MQRKRIRGSLIYRGRPSGVVVFAYWRDSNRRQHMKKVGPAWAQRHGDRWRKRGGTVPHGYYTPDDATEKMREFIDNREQQLCDEHADHRAGRRGRATLFEDVAMEWHRHGEQVAGWKPSTVRDRRSTLRVHLLPAFGHRPIGELTHEEVLVWWDGLHDAKRNGGRLSNRNANKLLADLRSILNWARPRYRLSENVAEGSDMRKHRELRSERPDFFSVEEVESLCRAAASDQDALLFRTAALAGLRRGELVSLRWRDIDFGRSLLHVTESVSAGQDARVKDEEGRTVPLAPQLAQALAAWRPDDAEDDDLVFPGLRRVKDGQVREKLDGDALSSRYRAARDEAGLRPLRFHDLRHTFGSLAVDGGASLVQVQAWMGHADIKTTMRYLHSKSRAADAELLGAAFTTGAVEQVERERLTA